MSKNKKLHTNLTGSDKEALKEVAAGLHDNAHVVWIKGPIMPGAITGFPATASSILLVAEGRPIDPQTLSAWREWAMNKAVRDLKMVFYDGNSTGRLSFCESALADWHRPWPEKEECKIRAGEWVSMPKGKTSKGDPSLLTLQFGKTGELLSHLDWVKTRFENSCRGLDRSYKAYVESILKYMKKGGNGAPKLGDEMSLDFIPRILLLGETGVGKTLFARYLASSRKFVRVSIPEYLQKEDMFEYDFFGYSRGAYTGGKEDGSLGILLENIGGVVFLDEIGEASPAIQAKLLAFMDDYRVRPRGCGGEAFYCPVLLVGATNKDIRDASYRNDLVQRFTDISEIPPLRDRKKSFPFLIDCLLQNIGINTGGSIKEIGKEAYCKLKDMDYLEGNFRELENLMRHACRNAGMEGRDYIVISDLQGKDINR